MTEKILWNTVQIRPRYKFCGRKHRLPPFNEQASNQGQIIYTNCNNGSLARIMDILCRKLIDLIDGHIYKNKSIMILKITKRSWWNPLLSFRDWW